MLLQYTSSAGEVTTENMNLYCILNTLHPLWSLVDVRRALEHMLSEFLINEKLKPGAMSKLE